MPMIAALVPIVPAMAGCETARDRRGGVTQHQEYVGMNPNITTGSREFIDEALKACLHKIFIGRRSDDAAAASMIEVARIRMVQRVRA